MRPSLKVLFLPSILIALSMSGCSGNGPKISAEMNQSASLAGEFAAGSPANPLKWKVITSESSKTDSTMSPCTAMTSPCNAQERMRSMTILPARYFRL